jgi:1-deoxy-D-xylulose 5-phosphate reductoisomerase
VQLRTWYYEEEAQMGLPDMGLPIQFALELSNRLKSILVI